MTIKRGRRQRLGIEDVAFCIALMHGNQAEHYQSLVMETYGGVTSPTIVSFKSLFAKHQRD